MMDFGKITRTVDFKRLASHRWRVSTALTFVMVATYFSFIFLLAKNRAFLSLETDSGLPIGIPIGVGIILLAWALTGIYIIWANSQYDNEVARLRKKFEE